MKLCLGPGAPAIENRTVQCGVAVIGSSVLSWASASIRLHARLLRDDAASVIRGCLATVAATGRRAGAVGAGKPWAALHATARNICAAHFGCRWPLRRWRGLTEQLGEIASDPSSSCRSTLHRIGDVERGHAGEDDPQWSRRRRHVDQAGRCECARCVVYSNLGTSNGSAGSKPSPRRWLSGWPRPSVPTGTGPWPAGAVTASQSALRPISGHRTHPKNERTAEGDPKKQPSTRRGGRRWNQGRRENTRDANLPPGLKRKTPSKCFALESESAHIAKDLGIGRGSVYRALEAAGFYGRVVPT
jgi:hypothetical protein